MGNREVDEVVVTSALWDVPKASKKGFGKRFRKKASEKRFRKKGFGKRFRKKRLRKMFRKAFRKKVSKGGGRDLRKVIVSASVHAFKKFKKFSFLGVSFPS